MPKSYKLIGILTLAFVTIGLLALPTSAQANMSYTPWIHSMIQNGADMEITVSIFEETDATNNAGEPIPGLDVGYTLGIMSPDVYDTVFEERIFQPEDADEVTEKICHHWDEPDSSINGLACGDNSECPGGFCAVAYRYMVTDHCPPFGSDMRYWMTTSTEYDLLYEGEGLGMSNYYDVQEEVGNQCDEWGCNVIRVGLGSNTPTLLQILVKLI